MNNQNVINICLTICMALLVYQNQQLKDQVKNVSFERIETINALSAQVDKVKTDLLSDDRTQSQDNALLDLRKLVTSIQKINAAQNKEIAIMTGSFKRLPKPIGVEAIRKIIEKCKVPNYSSGAPSATNWNHGHNSREC
jgi:uncharacterized protein YdgA (DUF945 family)